MRDVVRAIEVYTIPASMECELGLCLVKLLHVHSRGEAKVDHYASRAWFLGEVLGFWEPGVHILQAGVSKLRVLVGCLFVIRLWAADKHAESLKYINPGLHSYVVACIGLTGWKALTFDCC